MLTTADLYLKFIPYYQFDLWDAKRYTTKAISSKYDVVELGTCIKEENKKYKLYEEGEKEFGILGVNNKTGIFDAYLQKGKDINQAYKKMEIGWLAYNPYRINVGSIGIRLKEHRYEYISPAYVVFSCKSNLLPEYLFLLFKTDIFNKVINENTTGSVRQNLTIDILRKLKIPLPSPKQQEKLVINYLKKFNASNDLTKQIDELECEIEKYLFDSLGLVKKEQSPERKRGLHFINYESIFEWGIDKILSSSNDNSSKHQILSIEVKPQLAINIFRGKSPKYKEGTSSYILNQKCNRWNEIDISFMKSIDEEWAKTIEAKYYTREGDILINSTGEGTIGRASYIKKEYEGLLYDSHILLLRLNPIEMNPELFVEIFNSVYGQNQVNDLKSAQATKQTELGTSNLIRFRFPIPENIDEQNSIVLKIKKMRNKKYRKLEQCNILLAKAKREFENIILG
jgi:type I restriction enzyme, S subunit